MATCVISARAESGSASRMLKRSKIPWPISRSIRSRRDIATCPDSSISIVITYVVSPDVMSRSIFRFTFPSCRSTDLTGGAPSASSNGRSASSSGRGSRTGRST